jgi:hypothetical protein
MYEVVFTDKEVPDGTAYNDPPINFREITEKDFAQSQFLRHIPTFVEYRQMILNEDLSPGKLPNGRFVSAFLYWFNDDTGVAIAPEHYEGKVRYFSFGCNHSLGHKTYQAGQTYTCSKCQTKVKEGWMELIVEDSGWSLDELSSIPSRGIRDYNRTIKFSAPLSPSHLAMVSRFLKKTDSPGYTGIITKHLGGDTYTFSTSYDSSD